jgi:hypothetical protein
MQVNGTLVEVERWHGGPPIAIAIESHGSARERSHHAHRLVARRELDDCLGLRRAGRHEIGREETPCREQGVTQSFRLEIGQWPGATDDEEFTEAPRARSRSRCDLELDDFSRIPDEVGDTRLKQALRRNRPRV